VPEGDTIHRTAAALRTALVNQPLQRFSAPRSAGPAPTIGSIVEKVDSHGKHLEITFDDAVVLHTHMRLTGSWHLYHLGERWRRPSRQARAIIEVPGWLAVCFNAPIVETYRIRDRRRHPGYGRLGPDLCDESADLASCIRLLRGYVPGEMPVAEVLLDQRVMCGVGNVFRCEILWACEMSPFAPVSALKPSDCVQLVETAAELLRANLHQSTRRTTAGTPEGLAVYGRNGQRCARCGEVISVRRFGEQARLLYWCAGCQTRREPDGVRPPTPVDGTPRPVDQLFLDDLPWRRHRAVAGH
jgi:endonuclease-8